MIFGNINQPESYQELLSNPVWKTVFDWLKQVPEDKTDGKYAIDGENIYAYVSTNPTISRNQGSYEAHNIYIDFHLCREGGEIIEWAPTKDLSEKSPYDLPTDTTFYLNPDQSPRCTLTPGSFAILFPGEAHLAKINDGTNTRVQKIVVKVKATLV